MTLPAGKNVPLPAIADVLQTLSRSPYTLRSRPAVARFFKALEALPSDEKGVDYHDLRDECAAAASHARTIMLIDFEKYQRERKKLRRACESAVDLFSRRYPELMREQLDSAVDELLGRIEAQKVFQPDGGVIDGFKKFFLHDIGEVARSFGDDVKELSRNVPFFRDASGRYRAYVDELLGPQALERMHGETLARLERELPDAFRQVDAGDGVAASGTAGADDGLLSSHMKAVSAAAAGALWSTVTLAAGWHTVAWSTVNLFLPLLQNLVLPLLVVLPFVLHNREVEKKKRKIGEIQSAVMHALQQQQTPILLNRIRSELDTFEKTQAGLLFEQRFTGIGGPAALEEQLQALAGFEHDAFAPGLEGPSVPQLLKEAVAWPSVTVPWWARLLAKIGLALPGLSHRLESDALFGASLFDRLLSVANASLGLGVNPHTDGAAGIIEALGEKGFADEAAAGKLTVARRTRNRLVHRIDACLAMSVKAREESVRHIRDGLSVLLHIIPAC